MAQIINVTVDDTTEVVNVTISDGLITASGGGTFIAGFLVKKGPGKSGATIEATDKVAGWIGDIYVAGESIAGGTPTDISDLEIAVQGEIL